MPGSGTGADGMYRTPDGRNTHVTSNMGVLFSDDFGGSAVDPTNWIIYDGGLPAVTLGNGSTQAAIGTGTTGMTDAVGSSALVVSMGTTNGAERWYLSQKTFAGSEDLLVNVAFSQRLGANSVFVGLVEIDPSTGYPLLNPNLAGDFTNRGGVELGATTVAAAYSCQAVADSSGSVATGTAGTAAQTFVTGNEVYIEFHAEDVIASTSVPDAIVAKATTPARVSTQCPNDARVYKLLMRFHNVSVPATNTTVTVQRVLLVASHESRVEVTSGRGDQTGMKALPVNVVGGVVATVSTISNVSAINGSAAVNGHATHRLISAATTNPTSVKATAGRIYGGSLTNTTAAFKYFKVFAKASAPTVGTDTPFFVIGIPPNSTVSIPPGNDIGTSLTLGIAYSITGGFADSDTTATAVGDVLVTLMYT